jgi:hypothetical protein
VEAAYDRVFRAAAILANVAGRTGSAVKASYRGLLGAMTRHAWQWSCKPGPPGQANRAHLGHFNIAKD